MNTASLVAALAVSIPVTTYVSNYILRFSGMEYYIILGAHTLALLNAQLYLGFKGLRLPHLWVIPLAILLQDSLASVVGLGLSGLLAMGILTSAYLARASEMPSGDWRPAVWCAVGAAAALLATGVGPIAYYVIGPLWEVLASRSVRNGAVAPVAVAVASAVPYHHIPALALYASLLSPLKAVASKHLPQLLAADIALRTALGWFINYGL